MQNKKQTKTGFAYNYSPQEAEAGGLLSPWKLGCRAVLSLKMTDLGLV